jgi:large subunit ribosomal protein L10
VAPAAALKEFFEETKSEAIEVKAGVLSGKVIGPEGVKALADLPSREQLLGVVAATLLAPISNLARALNGNITKIAYALEAVRKQKESA